MTTSGSNMQSIVILIASAVVHAFLGAVVETTGVYHVIFLEAFGGGSGNTAVIASLNTSMFFAIGPLSSLLMQYIGFRATAMLGGILGSAGLILSSFARSLEDMIFTFGLFSGLGLGISYIPSITIVGYYFTTHRALAFGVASAGTGIGRMLAPMFINKCHEHYGWRGTLLIMGAVTLNICVCAALFKPPEDAFISRSSSATDVTNDLTDECSDAKLQQDKLLTQNSVDSTKVLLDKEDTEVTLPSVSCGARLVTTLRPYLNLFKLSSFRALCIHDFLFCIGYGVALVHLSAFGATKGLTMRQGSILFSTLGLTTFLGKVALSATVTFVKCNSTTAYVGCFLLAGAGTVLCGLASTFSEFVTYAAFFGTFASAWGAVQPSVILEMMDVSLFGHAYGAMNLFIAVGMVIGPPIAGWLYDISHFYPTSFYFGGSMMVASAMVMIKPCILVHKKRKECRRLSMQCVESAVPADLEVKPDVTEVDTTNQPTREELRWTG